MKNLNAANFLSVTIIGTSSTGMACLWLLDASVKSLVLLAAGALVCFLLSRASAATRHWIWATTLIGLIIMPAATLLLPEWRILPSWLSIESRLAETASVDHPLPPALTPSQIAANTPIELANANDFAPLDASDLHSTVPSTIAAPHSNGPLAIRFNANLLLAIWSVGVLLLLSPIVLAIIRLQYVERASICYGTLDPKLLWRVAKAAEEIGVKPPRIIVGPAGAMPMVWSFGSGRLLLPKDCDQWSAERFNAVLSHELIHLRRRDPMLFTLGLVARAMNWFNPLAWYALRRLRIECERACDDHVLRLGVDPSDYATHLLEFSTGMRPARGTSSLAFAMASKPNIEQRIVSLLDEKLNRCAVTFRIGIALLVIVSCAVAVLATLRATVANEAAKEAVAQAGDKEVEIKYPYCVVEVDKLAPRSLAEVVSAFNLESQQSPTGVLQRPISEPETLAAIAKSLKQPHVAESVKTILREIEKTKTLPAKAYFRRFTRFDDEQQMHGVWWVRLCIEGDEPPMYSVSIRTTHLFTRPYSQLERQQNSEEGVTLINRRSSYFEEPPNIRLAEEFPQGAIDKLIASTQKGLADKSIDELKALFDWQGAVLGEFVESELQMLMKATVHSIKFEPLRLNGNLLHWSGFRAYHPNLPVVGYLEIVYTLPDDPAANAKKISLELGKPDDEFRLVNYVAEESKFPAGKVGFSIRGHTEQLADGIYQLTSLISNPGELISAHLANEEIWHRDYDHKRKPNQDAPNGKANEAETINKQIPVRRIPVADVVKFLEKLYRERIEGAPGASGFFSIIPEVRTNSLLVNAQPDDTVRIEALVKSMDDNHAARKNKVADETGAICKEIALVSSDVKDIVKTLRQFFGGEVEGRVRAFGLEDEQPTPEQFVDALQVGGQPNTPGPTVALVADCRANVVWAFALPEDIAKLEALIKRIDVPKAERDFANDDLIAIVGTEDELAKQLIPPKPAKPSPDLSRVRLWRVRIVDSVTGKPIPQVDIRIQPLTKEESLSEKSQTTSQTGSQQKAVPIDVTSDAQGIVTIKLPAGESASVEVISTDWWQVGKTLLDHDLIADLAENESPNNQPIDIKLNRGQPIDSMIKRQFIR